MAEEISNSGASLRIEGVIIMALKNEISWKMLDFILEELTPTLNKSKQVIKMLLKELQALQSSIQKMKAGCDCQKIIESADNAKDSEQKCNTEIEIIEPECQPEIENKISQDDVPIDNSFTACESDNEVFGNRLQSKDLNDIELVEEFKDQLYTFIGNDVDKCNKRESHEVDDDSQLIGLNEDQTQDDIVGVGPSQARLGSAR